jgi:hypothetical protein
MHIEKRAAYSEQPVHPAECRAVDTDSPSSVLVNRVSNKSPNSSSLEQYVY